MPTRPDAILAARILIVDDNASNVELLHAILESAGYTCVTSTQISTEVCALHQAHAFDLILLDLQMPGMDGFEVMEGLKAIEADGYAPILAITAQPGHKQRALQAGAKDFIAKPFDLIEVQTRIHNMLEVRLLYKQLKASVTALESLAMQDALTGLPNRRLLMDRLGQSMLASQRTGEYCAVMFMDLDKFKLLNDTLGHDMGDLLLRQVATRLLGCVREGDTVARLGGDEFVVLLRALSRLPDEALTQTLHVAQKVLDSLRLPYDLAGQAYSSTPSIGALAFRGGAETGAELLKKADAAMYQAKSVGRNTVRFFGSPAFSSMHVQNQNPELHVQTVNVNWP